MMSAIRVPVLSAQDIESLEISFDDVLMLVESSFRAHGEGRFENPPKPAIHTRDQSFIHAMPAYVKDPEVAGLKWVSGYGANRDKGLPTIVGLIVLNDPDTGLPTALMDGTWVTNVRTAAATGVTARHVLRGDETKLSIIGAGLQGIYNTLVLSKVMPQLKTVLLHDSFPAALDRYKTKVVERLPNLDIQVAESAEDAMRRGEVVLIAIPPLTAGLRPFNSDWLQPGSTVITISNGGFEEDQLFKHKVIADDWNQYCSFLKNTYKLPDSCYAQTGELVTGQKKGRTTKDEVIGIHNVGLGIHDVVVAQYVLNKAKERGIGTEITLDENAGRPLFVPPM